jgi:NADPH:quinone reductase-like Zn-dependent oxidoreductase
MKAVLFHEHGGPEVLQYADFPTPEPKAGEALVRLQAAALNRVDVTVRIGWPGLRLEYPHIPGCDGAGTVAALGEGVAGLTIGDHVVINANLGCGKCEYCLAGADNMCRNWHLLGETVRGTYAEYVSLPERQLHKLPMDFDLRAAAAAALVYQTAWHSLVARGRLRPAETVLIVGAGGGVNTASVQVAKLCGARVIVVASNAAKAALAERLGADLTIDRSKEQDWSRAAFLATGKRGVDAVVDSVGSTFMSSLRTLRKGGRLLTVGNTAGPNVEFDNRYVFGRHLSIIGSTMSTLGEFRTVMELVAAGKLKPVLDRAYPLKEAARAQERLQKGEQLGKITLDVG